MPIEGIIDGLRMAVARYPEDNELRCLVRDAEAVLTGFEERLDKSYLDGRYDQQSEDFELVLTRMFG